MKAQPPLGGCVLKQGLQVIDNEVIRPAAFRRLCVETKSCEAQAMYWGSQPPLGGCVLKLTESIKNLMHYPSRL